MLAAAAPAPRPLLRQLAQSSSSPSLSLPPSCTAAAASAVLLSCVAVRASRSFRPTRRPLSARWRPPSCGKSLPPWSHPRKRRPPPLPARRHLQTQSWPALLATCAPALCPAARVRSTAQRAAAASTSALASLASATSPAPAACASAPLSSLPCRAPASAASRWRPPRPRRRRGRPSSSAVSKSTRRPANLARKTPRLACLRAGVQSGARASSCGIGEQTTARSRGRSLLHRPCRPRQLAMPMRQPPPPPRPKPRRAPIKPFRRGM